MLQSLIFFHGPEIPIVKKTQQPLHCFSSSLCFFREPAISDPTYLFKWVIPGSLANIHTSDWVACIYDAEHIQQPQQNILFICCIKNITAVFSSKCWFVVYSSLDVQQITFKIQSSGSTSNLKFTFGHGSNDPLVIFISLTKTLNSEQIGMILVNKVL